MSAEKLPHPPSSPPPGTPGAQLRPPDFLLPRSDRNAEHSGGAKAGIYVSSGGQTYGPSTAREVVASVRTGYFGEDAVFWVESRNEWRPLNELARHVELPPPGGAAAQLELPPRIPLHSPPTEPVTPKWPGARRRPSSSSSSSSSSRGEKRRRERKGGSAKAPKGQLAGRLIVLAAILLAILITAGLLLLISTV